MGCDISIIPTRRADPNQSFETVAKSRDHIDLMHSFAPADALVVSVRLLSLSDIPPSQQNTFYGTHPFVELSLDPEDKITGRQLQRSSHKEYTFDPSWVR